MIHAAAALNTGFPRRGNSYEDGSTPFRTSSILALISEP